MKSEQDGTPAILGPEEFEKYRDILLREIELTANISGLQILVKDAVMRRKWADFEALMRSLAQIGGEFEQLDARREALFQNGYSRTSFYAFCSRLPPAERETLGNLYRTLKMDIVKIRINNDALAEYLDEARIMVTGFLEAVFPERQGQLYSRCGTRIEADMRSLVLNKSF
jgi:hypothetical protein